MEDMVCPSRLCNLTERLHQLTCQLPSHANRKQPHWESSLEKLQTSQKRHSDHCDYWIQHTHWNCHAPWCHPWHRSPERPHPPGGLSTFYMLQKGQHSNDAHIHDFQQMFERNAKSLTQNIMSGGLQLSSWEVFRDVGFLGKVFVTFRWKSLQSITVSHPHSPHLEFSHLFQPTRALQVIVHNENAPLSFFCRQSPQDMSNCLLSPLFSKNWHLNLKRKKKKNCHKPMLTHPQSCLTYFSTCSDHSFK